MRRSVGSSEPGSWGAHAEFGVEYLRERLALLKGVIPRRAWTKDAACYRIAVHADGTATVAATGLEVRMVLKRTVLNWVGSGTVMIESHALDALLGAYPAPRIRLTLDDAQAEVTASGDGVTLVLPAADPAKELKSVVEGSLTTSGWTVWGSDLARALERTRFATDPSSTRYALGGVALEFPEDGDRLALVATDGKRLARATIPVKPLGQPARRWQPATEAEPSRDLPILACKAIPVALKLARLAGDEGVVALAVIPGDPIDLAKQDYKPGLIQVVTKDAVLTAALPEGKFPRYRDAYPTAELRLAHADVLADRLATAVAASDSEARGVELVLADGMLMLAVTSGTKGKARLFLPAPESTGRATVTVDALFLRQMLDAAGSYPIALAIFAAKSPLLLRAGPSYECLLMPLGRDDDRKSPPPPKPATEPAPVGAGPEDDGESEDDPESEDDGGVAPEPPVPVAATADAHEGNGRARARKGRKSL